MKIESVQDVENLTKQHLATDEMLRRVDIVVLHHSLPNVTECALASILRFTDWPYKVTLYDTSMYPGIFSKIYNRLIWQSTCDFIAYICSDATVSDGWLSRLMQTLISDPNVVWVMPLVLPACNFETDVKPNSGIHIVAGDKFSDSISVFKRKPIMDLAGYDERFYHFGHDEDLLIRLERAGYKLLLNSEIICHHLRGTTTRAIYIPYELAVIDEYTKKVKREREGTEEG